MKRLLLIILLAGLVTARRAQAEDLTGANRFLCSAGNATACDEEGVCESGPAYLYNIPMFIEVDLGRKQMRTTRGNGGDRTTAIQTLRRQGGTILLQGFESGRAFSFLIDEKAGMLSASVTANGFGVALFGSCTSLSATPNSPQPPRAATPPQEKPAPPGDQGPRKAEAPQKPENDDSI